MYEGELLRGYHPYNYGAAVAEWERPRAWRLQQRAEELNVGTKGRTVKRGGEREDKGVGRLWML